MNRPIPATRFAADEPVDDDAFRASHVGGSEVAALFDCHPWLTRFELWNRKAGKIETPTFNEIGPGNVPLNERAFWGVRFEQAIIAAAMERWGYLDRDQIDRLSNGRGLGGHPDRRVICTQRGPGILETKMVDWLERKKWGDEPPLHQLLQAQTYAGLDGVEWADVIVLVGGNSLERHQYDFRPSLFAKIERRVEEFWTSVRAGKAPKPDYSRDGKVLAELYADANETVIDLRLDNRATHLACEFLEAAEARKAAEAHEEALKAELLDKMRGHSVAMVEGYNVRAPTIAAVPDKIITDDMVGETIKGRRAYRRFYVKERAA